MWAGSGDSQLVNSVYFDNRQMQLYHGRMDKTPGAIALRLRWYGTEIKNVYVERKTHLDSWTGNVSVKERFSLEPEQVVLYLNGSYKVVLYLNGSYKVNEFADDVVPYLNGSYKVNEFADDMKRKGKKDTDIQAACKLFSQIARVIESKQLGPTVRTQYMRTAFQGLG
ncbi:VTC domain-containing protein [Baffinella frigidus]|nr:VTC domain-containing protein [Cryptophyta sp. CCMP2293]